ncbi:hypothetical protein CEXT_687141 [Caerostris extrusa]|uniref:Uncharacterized protein n=1 Tax=Caerostris extrusa TaxID=172846 RepID=A0AAV4P3R6_CAEEX|nr:hypothetical protein CEXT_687141 [Caerostris extrusa]
MRLVATFGPQEAFGMAPQSSWTRCRRPVEDTSCVTCAALADCKNKVVGTQVTPLMGSVWPHVGCMWAAICRTELLR